MRTLRSRIILSFVAVITLIAVLTGGLGYFGIRRYVFQRAQGQLRQSLRTARVVFDDEVDRIRRDFELLGCDIHTAGLQEKMGLDYLFEAVPGAPGQTPYVQRAMAGTGAGGARIAGRDELYALDPALADRAVIAARQTPRASDAGRPLTEGGLVLEYAYPCFDADGRLERVLCGGRLVNRYHGLVDRVRKLVFDNRAWQGRPVGTVTVFQNDVRVATNVQDRDGQRALGTRVSDEVYEYVLRRGEPFFDRAFVVTDWYLTAYEPIRDAAGQVIGILYVGLLEAPFRNIMVRMVTAFAVLLAVIGIVAAGVSFTLAGRIARPVHDVQEATAYIARGDYRHRVQSDVGIRELQELVDAFHGMAGRLAEREQTLNDANTRLNEMNKNYLDLIGFVTHELKGILATTILNAYSVRDGYLGIVNFKQRRALDAVARNLDYFDATVKNFLNLSRIEKGEMACNPVELQLGEDVFDNAFESFRRQAEEKDLRIENNVPRGFAVQADPTLIQIVVNNLVDNAVKYTPDGCLVTAAARDEDGATVVEVYNDGVPMAAEVREKLFDKFYRALQSGQRRVQGTGLGLHITREIVKAHGGTIRAEARERGNTFIFTIQRSKEHGNAA